MGAAGVEGGGAATFPFLFFGRWACGAPSATVARSSPPEGGGAAGMASGASGGLASSVEVGPGGGSSSNQGAVGTGSPEGDCAGGGPARGAAALRVAPRDAERKPMRLITAW